MHSVEVFATTQGGGELAQLLNLYRSASLEIIEDMMQHPDLEKVGDKHTAKKVWTLSKDSVEVTQRSCSGVLPAMSSSRQEVTKGPVLPFVAVAGH